MRQPLRAFEPPRALTPEELRELTFDPIERGRRLSAFKRATEGKVLLQVRRGVWEYVTPVPPSRNFTQTTICTSSRR